MVTVKPLAVAEHEAARDHRRQRFDVGALGQLNVVLEEDRHADRRDQRRQAERAAQRPVGDPLDRPAVGRGEGHRDQQDQDQRERHPGDAEHAEQGERDDREEGTDHVDFAVGEIDHADDAVDHAVADRDQAVHGAQGDAVDQLLQEIRHPCRCALRLVRRGSTVVPESALEQGRARGNLLSRIGAQAGSGRATWAKDRDQSRTNTRRSLDQ